MVSHGLTEIFDQNSTSNEPGTAQVTHSTGHTQNGIGWRKRTSES
jgi:hypothetical protein